MVKIPKIPTKIPGKKGGKNIGIGQFSRHLITAFLILMLITGVYSIISERQKDIPEIALSELVSDINSGAVSKVTIEGEKIKIEFKDGTLKNSKKEVESSLSETLSNYGVSTEELGKVSLEVKNPSDIAFYLLASLPFLIPVILIVLFLYFASRQVKGSSMQMFSFGQSKARVIYPDDKAQKVTFNDVAGVKEAKEELKEIVDFLKNPKKFLDIGARIPKGVLLMGAPGTGKTLLARAVAGEAGVPFFHISGSEFVEMFVGVGASRVRDLFLMAKKAAPSIIFIDEIDAVGRHRGGGTGGGHDEREQTLNQILVEMDGFEPHEKVIVMAATNRPDVLDTALLRPGRFDRRVMLDLPDIKDREEILTIHSHKKPFAEDVNLKVIAERTPGFSGADLYSLMNEAAILAAREDRKHVSQFDLIRSIEKVMLGPERKSRLLSEDEKKIAAYHEAGHALVASVLTHADPVHKVSVVSRGRAAGYTLKLPTEERHLHSKAHFVDDIAVSLGGYMAEKMTFGDITTGASNDLQVATSLARDLVTKYGMSEKVGPVAWGDYEGAPILGGAYSSGKSYSESIASLIDGEVSSFMNEGRDRAENVLKEHHDALKMIADELIEKETIEREEFEKILILNKIKPKRKKDTV
ncbi:MAG: ATP-dependent zinc metalloprotease FtsH [Parcubacteria group bacterium]|nr:ATP-dependent zinc metalloprotease FtsH [Parcubacteria group bacterium]MCR4342824.1 ATP-dependent zinc metalloprotease FtsH [Patescibacteria group bacterium]